MNCFKAKMALESILKIIEKPAKKLITAGAIYTCNDCEDMSGTYSVHQGSDCNPIYSLVEVKQFPEQRSGTYENCSLDPGCQGFIIVTDIKTGEKECKQYPNTNYFVFHGNSFYSIGGSQFTLCDDVIKLDRGDCQDWLKKTGPAPNIDYDFSKFGTLEGSQKIDEICLSDSF